MFVLIVISVLTFKKLVVSSEPVTYFTCDDYGQVIDHDPGLEYDCIKSCSM